MGGLAEGAVRPGRRESWKIAERWKLERNAVRPRAPPPARWETRGEFKRPVCRCRPTPEHVAATACRPFQAATPQPHESSRGIVCAPAAGRRLRSGSAAPLVITGWVRASGTLYCCCTATSALMIRRWVWDSEPWQGSGRGVASKTRRRLGLTRELRRLVTPRARCPVAERISSQPADGCAAAGGISSEPLNGARRERDLNTPTRWTARREKDLNTPTRWTGPGTESCVKSAWPGPRCLRRATSNPQRQRSLLGTFGRANHPYGQPGQQGIVPPGFLWRETLEKPDNHSIVAHSGAVA